MKDTESIKFVIQLGYEVKESNCFWAQNYSIWALFAPRKVLDQKDQVYSTTVLLARHRSCVCFSILKVKAGPCPAHSPWMATQWRRGSALWMGTKPTKSNPALWAPGSPAPPVCRAKRALGPHASLWDCCLYCELWGYRLGDEPQFFPARSRAFMTRQRMRGISGVLSLLQPVSKVPFSLPASRANFIAETSCIFFYLIRTAGEN